MRSTAFRALGLIGFGLGPAILLAGCGEQETGARTTLNSIQPSSYVVRPPVTTEPEADPDAEASVDADGRSDLPQEYTIQPGDFPVRIANLYDITLEELANFNGWTPPNYSEFPNIGETISIPPGAVVPGAAPDPEADDAAPEAGTGDDADENGDDTAEPGEVPSTTLPGGDGECVPGDHVIAEGDIPVRVADQYDISLEQLESANAGNPAYQSFIVGQTINIPCP